MKKETKDFQPIKAETIQIGIVGLGMMGCSITTCLLMAGHQVVAVAPIPLDMQTAESRIKSHLEQCGKEGLIGESACFFLESLIITEDYRLLKDCKIVVECTLENLDIKRSVFKKIESVISADSIVTSNTSAIPITILQQEAYLPNRFIGLHWAEPSHTTRFLEIICGAQTDIDKAEWLYEVSHLWEKEPTLVRKDIRGFITNRLMYAMYREAFSLVENGYATIEDVDRACRNNAGYWMTFAGVFRWMDLTGVAAYHAVIKDLFPTLSNETGTPKLIDEVVKSGGKGILNAKGFYHYTPEEAEMWRKTFEEFSFEIRRLAKKYPVDVVEKKLAASQARGEILS